MAQSAATVTPENPTPPTNLSYVGATPPLDPAQAVVDDGIGGLSPNSLNEPGQTKTVFAAKTAAAGAGTSVDSEGKGTEVLVAATSPNPSAIGQLNTVSDLGSYTTNPNRDHASSLSPLNNPTLTTIAPTTSVHGTAPVTMTATGTGFTKQSVITIAGVPQKTTFVSATSLTCTATPPAAAGAPAVAVLTGGAVVTAPQTWTIT